MFIGDESSGVEFSLFDVAMVWMVLRRDGDDDDDDDDG